MKNKLLPSFILLLFLLGTGACNSIKDPEFQSIENIKLSKLGVGESTLDLDIVYTNPNKTRLKLKSAAGESWVDNNFLGHFTMDSLIVIPANGTFRIPVKLRVDMNKLLKTSLLAYLNPEVLIKVTGNARVGKGFIYVNYPIKYEGKQNLRELIK